MTKARRDERILMALSDWSKNDLIETLFDLMDEGDKNAFAEGWEEDED